jgi:RNA polymerase sigma-70 factor, ECF subfamily
MAMLDDVVCRCQKGEEGAFHELFRLHGGMIQKITMRMTRNAEWQSDIFQDVVEQVIENISSFRGECAFSTWLYRVTVNAALGFLQKEGNYKNILPFDDETTLPAARENGGPSLERREMFTHAVQALMTLPQENKDILSLFYFADRPVEEIARLTGKSDGAIKAILWKGRRAIIKYLKKQGLLKEL